jgi:hypothetical protein
VYPFADVIPASQALHKGASLQGHDLNMNWYDSTQSQADAGEVPELTEEGGENEVRCRFPPPNVGW